MKVAILGLGLIGSSWGLALKQWARTEEGRNAKLEVIGFDVKGKVRSEAERKGVCDKTAATPMEAVKEADIVIVATPPIAVREIFEDISHHLVNGAIITDTASTKREVMQWAKDILPRNVNFIGGHPMAGKTASQEGASADLFAKCTYCLMPLTNASEESIEAISKLVQLVGASPHFIDPFEHDSYVAAISHLPFLLSAAFTNLTTSSEGWREISRLTAGGFQDMTRLAGGSVEMHLDICRTNSDTIISWLDRFQKSISEVRGLVEKSGFLDERGRSRPPEETDPAELKKYFEKAQDGRLQWEQEKSNERHEAAELINIPTKKELQAEYTRMFTGGFFTRKRPSDNGSSDQPRKK